MSCSSFGPKRLLWLILGLSCSTSLCPGCSWNLSISLSLSLHRVAVWHDLKQLQFEPLHLQYSCSGCCVGATLLMLLYDLFTLCSIWMGPQWFCICFLGGYSWLGAAFAGVM